ISLPEVFSYFWSTGETTSTIQACQSGSYSVEIIQNGCAFKDTIQLSMDNPLLINLEDTLLLCNGDGAWLDAGALSVPVIWSPGGDTTAIIWIQNPGLYSITAVNGCGNFYDSIMVEAHVNNFEFQNDSIPVETNHSIAIDVGDVWQTILWSTGDCTPIIQVFTPGTYWVQVIDDYGCDAGDTLVVYQVNDNPAINLSHILCYPNPTFGELLIEGLSGQVTIEVYDYLGKRLISLSSNETKQYINLNSYPIGIYYLLIQTSSQKRESWKVVKI
ncbi:MAG: T9SS type A sorting domain-containing protein, partial [Bacteroidales bacterium]|nr:T9SS type A sorting domain-containing protein [Bacteroidales bacterium]